MLFIDSLLAALSPFTLAMNFVGVMLGMIVGALPGLGSVVAITICLPFTFGMTSVSAIALLLGVYCGSICGGSIAAVLINTPGTPQSAATAFDGYPMARAGKPGKAIGWALAASIFGGVFSCVILTFAAPQIAVFALQFGPLETCALILMGLTCISSVSANNQFKGLAMGVLGLLLACVGMSPFSAESRFTFDIFALNSGIDLVAVIVGVFALSEVLDRVERMRREARVENGTSCRVQLPSLGEWRGRMSGLVKSSLIGTFVGILPGTGAATAAFLSYGEARRSSPRRENIGKGEPDGIIAAESSNNAVTGGALVPSLALGIPGDPVYRHHAGDPDHSRRDPRRAPDDGESGDGIRHLRRAHAVQPAHVPELHHHHPDVFLPAQDSRAVADGLHRGAVHSADHTDRGATCLTCSSPCSWA